MRKVKPKQLKGRNINGPMLVELAQAYTTALNTGQLPAIDTAWNYVQGAELERAYKMAISDHETQIMAAVSNAETTMSPNELNDLLKANKKQIMETFKQSMLTGSDILEQAKGKEVLARMQKEFKELAHKVKERNNRGLQKDIKVQIDKHIESNIKVKITTEATFKELQTMIEELQEQLTTKYQDMDTFISATLLKETFVLSEYLMFVKNQTIANQEAL